MENKNDLGRFLPVLSICATLVVLLKFLLPKYGAIINTLYYFTPLLAVSITERNGILTVLRRYDAGVRKADLKKSLCYVLVIASVFPVLNILWVSFFGNLLHIGPFGTFGIPENDFVLYGIHIPENPVIRFAAVYLSSVLFALIAGSTYNMIFALGSEVAWRGFLNRRIRWGGPMKNIVVGAVWATWWLPVMISGGCARSSIAVAYVSFISLSFLLDSVFGDTRSLLVTSAVRGVVISSCGHFFIGGSPSSNGAGGLAGMVSLVVIALCMYIYRRSAVCSSGGMHP